MSTASTAATAVALTQVAKAMKALQPNARAAEQSVKSMSQTLSSTKDIMKQTFGELN